MKNLFFDLAVVFIASIFQVIGLHTFIDSAGFTAVGVDGIAVMMHKIFGINIGYVSMIINIPLLIWRGFF